jgi:predicted metal-dependent peptidase
LHLGLGHFSLPPKENKIAWNVACDCYIARFLYDLKIGRPPAEIGDPQELTAQSELKLYERFMEKGIPKELLAFGTAGGLPDMIDKEVQLDWRGKPRDMQWGAKLAAGISMAVTSAVNVAGGYASSLSDADGQKTPALAARDWFVSSYPLLGALAANFKVIEDPALCARMEISVAAINVSMREIYVNPAAALTLGECKFVMAHEFLHAGLRHDARAGGRDSYLWNVACDYVINDWLVQMDVGEMPRTGLLHDKELRGLSAENVYDRIVTDIRQARKLMTLRGVGLGDILSGDADWWRRGDGIALDDFYKNSLSQGLSYHEEQNRGYLPEGLIEEIRALSHPPIAWDVELAKWFDAFFSPLEKRRSYARLSRRQSSTPDIPRPSWVDKENSDDGRTFGVLLDTSGSMDRGLLAKALGAIASYSVSRDVPAVRVVFCDADAYDQGYMRPEDIAQTVKVKGRGGTILQPGIDLLERADDFPKAAPLLIITDGYCDVLRIRSREHAYLIPAPARLPFAPKGKVFRLT